MLLKEETIKEVCRFTSIKVSDAKIEKLQRDGLRCVPNPRVNRETADLILIDIYAGCFTFTKFNSGILNNIDDLNEYYTEEGLESLVTIP